MIERKPLVAGAFIAPALALYLLLVIYPLARGTQLSLTDSKVGNAADFVGLANYQTMWHDPAFWRALGITVSYAVVVVVLQNAIGLVLARALYLRPRARRVAGVLILMPTLMSAVMSGFVWSSLLAPNGALTSLLDALGLHSLTRIWLGDPHTALWSIAAVNVWMFAGYSAAIFLAGYMNMPRELLDAAQVDGASGARRFISIEWPLLAPALTVNVTLALIGSLKVFDLPLVMTNGGPAGSTETMSMLIYTMLFRGGGSFAYGAAIAMMLLVVVVVFAGTVQKVLRLREERL